MDGRGERGCKQDGVDAVANDVLKFNSMGKMVPRSRLGFLGI